MKTKYIATCITLIFIVFSMAFTHAQDSWAVKLPIKGYPKKMIQASDGGYVLLAGVNNVDGVYNEIGIFKYTNQSIIDWYKTYSFMDSVYYWITDMAQLPDGGISVVGSVAGRAFIIKTNVQGDLSWFDTLRFNNQTSWFNEIEPTDNNDLLVIGGGSQYWILHKYDNNGNLFKSYDQDTFPVKILPHVAHILKTSDSKYVIFNSLMEKNLLEVFISDDNAQHFADKNFPGIWVLNVAETANKDFLLLGNGVAKINKNLDSLWHQPADTYKRLGFTGQSNRDISPSSDGGFVICGKVSNSLTEEAFMLKADAQGNKLWDKVYFQSVVWDAVSIIGQPDGGNVMFMEGRRSVGVVPDMWIVKTTPDGEVGIEAESDFLQLSVKVYPNPLSGQLTVELPETGEYMLEIISLDGKLIRTEQFNSQILHLDTDTFPKGILIMKITDKSKGTYITKIQNPS